ncbi:MAG: hypothetical protein AAFV53_31680 [Myxococcota bacterium]
MLNSALTGFIVALISLWAVYFFHRLWQQSLREDAADAIAAARDLGLSPWGSTYWPRVVLEGSLDGRAVRVEWRGGVLGARSRVTIDGQTQHLPLVVTAEALVAAVMVPSESDLAESDPAESA